MSRFVAKDQLCEVPHPERMNATRPENIISPSNATTRAPAGAAI
jgi:hypothetical protein